MSKFAKIAAVLCLALLVGACGGTEKTGISSTGAPTATSTPTDTPHQAGGGENCNVGSALAGAGAAAAAAATAAGGDLKTSLEAATAGLNKLVDLVPDDLKADARVVVNGYTAYYGVFAEHGYDYKKIPQAKAMAAVGAIATSEFTTSAKKVFGYFATRCGIANPFGG